ncbi:MAG: M24 family metallopeptidase [Dehalococcoidia bacterium]|nr:M24 family metallopeptidase [Dehalococcoidia bacterium]
MTNELFPRFSEAEYGRRFDAARHLMDREGVEALVIHGDANHTGSIHYLSNYPSRSPAWLVFPKQGEPSLFVHFYNTIPCTQALSIVKDVQCYWQSPPGAVAGCLRRLGLANASIGVIGLAASIPCAQFDSLKEQVPEAKFKDVSRPFSETRWVRSEEELAWFRTSAYLTDLTCELLEQKIRPGLSEYDLSAIIHEAFLHHGGHLGIHFIASTPMSAPDRFVPWQFLTPRTLTKGDVVITEITISYWGYGAQIHRPFAVGAEPTPLYRKLFEVAHQCFENVRKVLQPGSTSEQIIEATSIIEKSGFTVFDSVVHGEGGRNPELGTRSSPHPFEPWTFKENTVVVIQPNPITPDHKAGLQLGSAVVVRKGGAEVLHHYPFKFPLCGLE